MNPHKLEHVEFWILKLTPPGTIVWFPCEYQGSTEIITARVIDSTSSGLLVVDPITKDFPGHIPTKVVPNEIIDFLIQHRVSARCVLRNIQVWTEDDTLTKKGLHNYIMDEFGFGKEFTNVLLSVLEEIRLLKHIKACDLYLHGVPYNISLQT